MSEAVKAYPRHLRQDRICMSGGRAFFKEHGLSWNDFLENGIEASKLSDTGHPIAVKVAANAVSEAAREEQK